MLEAGFGHLQGLLVVEVALRKVHRYNPGHRILVGVTFLEDQLVPVVEGVARKLVELVYDVLAPLGVLGLCNVAFHVHAGLPDLEMILVRSLLGNSGPHKLETLETKWYIFMAC